MTFFIAKAVLWIEYPVRYIDRSIAFYNEVFGYGITRQEGGRNPIALLQAEAKSLPPVVRWSGNGTSIKTVERDN